MTRPAHVCIPLLIAVAAAAGACTAASPEPGELRPDDFASGATVMPPPDQPFFQIDAPAEVFIGTAWPDQRDIRVFNASGAMVPFARVSSLPAAEATRRVPLRSFQVQETETGGDPIVELDTGAPGLRLRVTPSVSGESAEYLLALVQEETQAIRALHFDWSDANRNWQQQVTIDVSQDLSSWTRVATSRPLLDLRAGDERLRHTEVPVTQVMPIWARYWRVQFAPGFVPELTSVQAELATAPIETEHVQLESTSEATGQGAIVMRLATAQPVSRILVMPAEANSVLPLTIEGRLGEGPWRTIRTAVAYRISSPEGEQHSDPIRLDSGLVDAIRLTPLGTSWRDAPPFVTLERAGLTLVVNARGTGPFLLAWGSRAAEDSAVPLTTLMPDTSPDTLAQLPEVVAASLQELGGPSRLTEATPAERASRLQTAMVWVLLVTGAMALSVLAFRIYRETNAGRPL